MTRRILDRERLMRRVETSKRALEEARRGPGSPAKPPRPQPTRQAHEPPRPRPGRT